MDGVPVDISDGDVELWNVTLETASTYHLIVGEMASTAFRMSGEVPLSVLGELVRSLVAYPADEWLDLPTSGDSAPEAATETFDPDAADRAPCELQRLEIREP